MGSHYLDDFVKEAKDSGDYEEIVAPIGQPWYNPDGDCIHFMTIDAPYIGERIDGFLTIFRHYKHEHAIGFMIKGVEHLTEKLRVDGILIGTEVDGDELISLSVDLLLFCAYDEGPKSPSRRAGYAQAFERESRNVLVPAGRD